VLLGRQGRLDPQDPQARQGRRVLLAR
jgi:hypothetical protein